jgi:hypothetical protein
LHEQQKGKSPSIFTHNRERSVLMTVVLEFQPLPKCLNILEGMLLKMVVDDFLVSYSSAVIIME